MSGDAVVAAALEVHWGGIGERTLCDACLGRLVGKAGHGLTNPTRGRLVREAHGLPEGPCWLCEGLLDEVPKFADLVIDRTEDVEHATFLIGCRVDPEVAAREESLWIDLGATHAENLKSEINREVGKLVEARTGRRADHGRPDVTVIVDTQFDVVEVFIAPLFIYGRYRKLSRGIPQTRWPCSRCRGKGCDHCSGMGKMYETSVEEVIAAPTMAQIGGVGHALHGMGREDVDALMLGNGRPFVLEIRRPRRRTPDLVVVTETVNGSGIVEVGGLRPSDRAEVVALKEDRVDKTYRAVLHFAAEVDVGKVKEGIAALAAARIAQRTPTRVSHRRADRVRHRTLKGMEMLRADGRTVEVLVTAEAGTYVKEVLHGDGGRTDPSLAGLCGVPCEVLTLDVVKIHDGG